MVAFDAARSEDVFVDQNRTQYLFQESCDVQACGAAGVRCDQVRRKAGNGVMLIFTLGNNMSELHSLTFDFFIVLRQ